jgi:hypothetical protein
VDGAQNVILSALNISNTPTVTSSYAINVVNGGDALVTRSTLLGGTGTSESIGVRVVSARATIKNNCQSLDPATGRCDDFCGSPPTPAIRGRFTPGTGEAYGVLVQDSPGTIVEESAICGVDGDTGGGIRVAGDGTGVLIRANLINAWGGALDSHGVWLEDCGGAAPWIVDNQYIAAGGDSPMTRTDGVRAMGDCHPVVDSNVQITGGGEGGSSGANGVHCGANGAGTASACVVLGNALIEGSDVGFPPTSVGVRCDGDGCNRIAGNVITGRGGVDTWGVWLERTGAVVEDNTIDAGCAVTSAIGVYSNDSFARLENNLIGGGACNGGGAATSTALFVEIAAGGNEIDVHSNTIDGRGLGGAAGCDSAAVRIGAGSPPPTGGVGIFRNNIMLAGACPTRAGFSENTNAGDPRIFESNDLAPNGSPPAVYVDEGGVALTDASMVNALTDMTVSGNITADPMFANYPMDLHLTAGSMCVDSGTTAGAPLDDFEGDPRSSPDIGYDEL